MSQHIRSDLVYVLACIGIVALLLGAQYLWELRNASSFFRDALKSNEIHEKVVYKQHEYDIGGIDAYNAPAGALSLAYHKASARLAPFFAMPAEDPEAFIASVDKLANVQDRLALKQANPEDARLIRSSLYPITLLRTFGDLERARIAFLRSGSTHDANRYVRVQNEVLRKYENAIETFRRGFSKAVPENTGQYATNTRLVSRTDVLNAIDKLESAMTSTKLLWQARMRCIHGHTAACAISDITLPPLNTHSESMSSISPQQYANAMDALGMFVDSEVVIDTDTLYQLNSSVCVKKSPQTALLYTFETTHRSYGDSLRSPFYTGDALALATAPVANLPFFEYFAKHGIEYVPARPNKYYRCAESGTESGLLLALDRIHEFAKSAPMHELLTDTDRAEFVDLEKRLSSRVVSEADVATYISRAAEPGMRKRLSNEQANEVIELYLALAYRSGGMPHTVREVQDNEQTNMFLSERGVSNDPGALFMFFARSAFVPLLLGDNTSAAGNHAALFKENMLPDEVQPTVYLSRLPHSEATRDKILSDFTFYQRIHTF